MPFLVFPADDSRARSRLDDLEAALEYVRRADLVDPASEEARERLLNFCREHDDALHRSCLQGHLTGSAVVVDQTRGKTLLLHHTKLDRWLQPGGHADGDGNLAAVALREAGEETGLDGLRVVVPAVDIDVHRIPARGSEPEHLHLDVRFLVLAPPDSVVRLNHESLGARWVDPGDAMIDSAELNRLVDRAVVVAAGL